MRDRDGARAIAPIRGAREAPQRSGTSHQGARSSYKMATVVTMLNCMGGASIDDLIAATGWQRHTLRAAISTQLRKRGLELHGAR